MKKPSPAGCGQKTAQDQLADMLHGQPRHPAKPTATMKRRALKKKPCRLSVAPRD
jgi:hypothetical protein